MMPEGGEEQALPESSASRPDLPSGEAGERSPEAEEGPKIISDVKFTKAAGPGGRVIYKSSDPSRKMIELTEPFVVVPEEGVSYDVEVRHDTKPNQPMSGKFFVKIIAEEGLPLEVAAEKRAEKTPLPVAVDTAQRLVYILETVLPLKEKRGPNVPSPEKFTHFTLDQRTLEVLEHVATAVELKQPCLLEGETATSKTSIIEYAAMVTGNEVLRLNLNGQTDTAELIGKFVPNDGRLVVQFEEALRHPEHLTAASLAILESANKAGRGLSLIESQKIAAAEGIKTPDWTWKDGIIPTAMKQGKWVILDELNLAEPQILERLNSVLEKSPALTLSEHEGQTIGEGGQSQVHPDFRIFGTMNPAEYGGRNAMTPAGKDRWTSYMYVKNPTEKEYLEMLKLLVYGEQPATIIGGNEYRGGKGKPVYDSIQRIPDIHKFLPKLAKLHDIMAGLSRREEIGMGKKERPIFTRRLLLEMLYYLEHKAVVDRKTGTKKTAVDAPAMLITRAVKRYYEVRMQSDDDIKKLNDQIGVVGLLKDLPASA